MQLDIDLFPFEPFAGRIWELRHNATRVVRRHCRGAQARARNPGRTSCEIKRSHLQVLDTRILKSGAPDCVTGLVSPLFT